MYGIRVPMAADDFVWILEDNKDVFNPKPLLFRTEDKAYEAAKNFGPLAAVKKYNGN